MAEIHGNHASWQKAEVCNKKVLFLELSKNYSMKFTVSSLDTIHSNYN